MTVSKVKPSDKTSQSSKAAPTKPLTQKQIAALKWACDQGKLGGTSCSAPPDLTKFNKTNLETAYPAVPGCSAARDEINVYQSKTHPQVFFVEDKAASGTKWTRLTKLPTIPVTHTKSST